MGGRASAALAALSLTSTTTDPDWLQARPTLLLSLAMAAGETVGDQLPKTPSRLEPAGIGSRLVLGALGGGLLARRYRGPVPLGVAVGAAGALAGSRLGARFRATAAAKFGNDHPGATIEDGLVVALAAAATR